MQNLQILMGFSTMQRSARSRAAAALASLLFGLAAGGCESPSEVVASDTATGVADAGPDAESADDAVSLLDSGSPADTASAADVEAPADAASAADAEAPADAASAADAETPADAASLTDAEAPADASSPGDAGTEDDSSAPSDASGPGDTSAHDDIATDTTPEPAGCEADPRPAGCACDDDLACASGLCAPTREGAGRCAGPCEDGCPDGLTCADVTTADGTRPLCIVRDLDLCRPCLADADCRGGPHVADGDHCVRHPTGEGSFCGLGCETDSDCPDSYACRSVTLVDERDARQCVPSGMNARCGCSPRAVGEEAVTTCAVEGRCEGERRCETGDAAGETRLGLCRDDTGAVCEPPTLVEVSFDATGGTVIDPVTVVLGDPYGHLPVPARPNWVFLGWWLGEHRIEPTSVVERREAHRLVARWEGVAMALSFRNPGDTNCEDMVVRFGAPYGPLCAATRTGYGLLGWWLGETPVTAETVVTETAPHDVVARWRARSYAVGFAGEGTAACTATAATFDETYGPLCEPTREGYTFTGWRLDGQRVAEGSPMRTARDHTLLASWTADRIYVAFEAGEGTDPVPPAITVTYGEPYGELATTARAGYTFGGWWTGPDGVGVEVTPTTPMTRTAYHQLFAAWEANIYRVTYDPRGGTACAAGHVRYAAAYGAIAPLCASRRYGYTLGGWEIDDTRFIVTDVSPVTTAGDHVLRGWWQPLSVDLAYDAVGGVGCESATRVLFGDPYGLQNPLCRPSRSGYDFVGWFKGDGADATLVTDTTPVADAAPHTLAARWTGVPFNVTLDLGAGSGCTATTFGVVFGQPYGEAAACVPTRTGHDFTGWFLDSGARVETTTPITSFAGVLRARWVPSTWTLTYDAAGGEGCTTTTVTWGGTYAAAVACVPVRPGYTFGGWSFTAVGISPVNATTSVTRLGPHTVYALWTANRYTVSYDSAGGTACTAFMVTFDTAYRTGSQLCFPGRTGYSFNGWQIEDDATGPAVTAASVVATPRNHVLRARWVARRVLLNFGNLSGWPCAQGVTEVTFDQPYGAALDACRPERAGYTFLGWVLSGTDTYLTSNDLVKQANEHFLYARWRANTYRVSFASGEGSLCPPIDVIFDTAYGPLCEPTRYGHTFTGWYPSPEAVSAMTATTTVKIDTDHTLQARWTPNRYGVEYDHWSCPGGSWVFGAPLGPLCTPSDPGYAFEGWYLDATATFDLATADTTIPLAGDIALYGRWSARSFLVTFDAAGGTPCESRTLVYEQPYGQSGPLCQPTRAGYAFGGWVRRGSPVDDETLVWTAEDHTLIAVWTGNPYVVTFNSNGGSACPTSSLNVIFGAAYAPSNDLCRPTRTGYTFRGWQTELGGGAWVSAATKVAIAADHTLHAAWTASIVLVDLFSDGGSACVPSRYQMTYEQPYGVSVSCVPTKAGFVFSGWYTASAGRGRLIVPETPVTTLTQILLYAYWTVPAP